MFQGRMTQIKASIARVQQQKSQVQTDYCYVLEGTMHYWYCAKRYRVTMDLSLLAPLHILRLMQ